MRYLLPVVAASLLCLPLAAQDKPSRPKITGIHHVRIYGTDPASGTKNWIAEIALVTDDVEKMRSYLVAHGVNASKTSKYAYDKDIIGAHFEVRDPEGNPISFTQRHSYAVDDPGPGDPWFVRIIHAGLVVHDRSAEDHFYKDVLGFHLYWQGGRKDDETDFVNMQVPDGTDWIE